MPVPVLLLPVIPYLAFIMLFILGWLRKSPGISNDNVPAPTISILIPVKNEQQNLPDLIEDLFRQEYPLDKFEIIFIDDHSNDSTCNIIRAVQQQRSNIRLITLNVSAGKKAALKEGLRQATGDFILTTDGDCSYGEKWLSTMARYYMQYPERVIIGPVFMERKEGLFNHFQSLEFLSLIASGAGASGIGHPILCNGANLGASHHLFAKAKDVYDSKVASGDDIFLLLRLKKHGYKTTFVKDKDAAVITKNTSNIKHYINQRTRWTFKSRFYRDPDIILVALTVLFTNVYLLSGLFISVIIPEIFSTFILIYLLKCFVDYILLYNVAKFFERTHLLRNFLIHQILYVFYVSFVGIAGHFGGEKWKTGK